MRNRSKTAANIVVTALAISLTSCTTLKPPSIGEIPVFKQIGNLVNGPSAKEKTEYTRKEELRKLPITDPKRWADLEVLWEDVTDSTDARLLSDQRVRIKSKGTVFGSLRHSETNFFIRAAAETKRAGYDGFVIVHMDYYKVTPKILSLAPDVTFSSRRWIGNYEDFRENMNEQNMFSSKRKAGQKTMDGVIRMLSDEDYPSRDRFNAEEIYLNYLTYEAEWEFR